MSHLRGIRLPRRMEHNLSSAGTSSKPSSLQAVPDTEADVQVTTASLLQRRSSNNVRSRSGPVRLSDVTLSKGRKRFRPGAGPTQLPTAVPSNTAGPRKASAPSHTAAPATSKASNKALASQASAPQLYAVGRPRRDAPAKPHLAATTKRTTGSGGSTAALASFSDGGAPVLEGDFEEL